MNLAPDTVRADIEAAFKQHAEPTEAEVVETAPEVESEATKQERARDDKGRFVSAGGSDKGDAGVPSDAGSGGVRAEAQQPVSQPAVDAPDKSVQRPDQPGRDAEAPSLAPPNGWPAEAKAKWHELSPEIMAAVQKREQDIAKFTSTRDEHASFGKEIYQTVQPYLATIKAEGGTPATAIQALLNTAYVLRTGSAEQKRHLLLQTARQYGIDLGGAQPTNGQPASPQLETLQQRLDRLEHERQQEREFAEQRLRDEVQTEIAAFAADPKHTHYEAVKGHMSALIAQGLAKGLQDAYDQAVWANPETRATLEAQKRAEEEQKRRAEAKQKAEAAKRRNVSITGGPGNTAAATAPGGRSVREELMAAMAASDGAV